MVRWLIATATRLLPGNLWMNWWWLSDYNMASCSPTSGVSTDVQGLSTGQTYINAYYSFYSWDPGPEDCYRSTNDTGDSQPVNVLAIQYTVAETPYGTADFIPGIGLGNTWNATLELGADSPICTGRRFFMNVRLRKASNVTLYSESDVRNMVDTPADSQFDVSGGLQTGVGDQRFFLISLQRIHPTNPNRHIRTVVAGFDFSGSVSATGLVNINCP